MMIPAPIITNPLVTFWLRCRTEMATIEFLVQHIIFSEATFPVYLVSVVSETLSAVQAGEEKNFDYTKDILSILVSLYSTDTSVVESWSPLRYHFGTACNFYFSSFFLNSFFYNETHFYYISQASGIKWGVKITVPQSSFEPSVEWKIAVIM